MKHNETKKFTGVPVGTKIIVTEAAKANYKGSAAVVINNENKEAVVATKFNEEIKVWDALLILVINLDRQRTQLT